MTQNDMVRHPMKNGYILSHPYIPSYTAFGGSVDNFGPFTVPEGKYWVMGDSRKNSEDSRYWGFLDKSLIHGRASFVIYSIDSEESLWLFELCKHPVAFWREAVRWDRTFKKLT